MTSLIGRCDCGQVQLTVQRLPESINACPCDFCQRVGAMWGYFSLRDVEVAGVTQSYKRASRVLAFHRCSTCGVVTHWIAPGGEVSYMGVNMTAFTAEALSGIPVVVEP